MLFVGTHDRQLDDKGRLALPAAFRPQLGEHCYLAFGIDTCIEVIPAEAFEALADELMAKVQRGEVSRHRQRMVSGSATIATIDKQGRIKVDDKMRAWAGLRTDDTVIVSGNYRVIEIWAPERHQQMQAQGATELVGDLDFGLDADLDADLDATDLTDATRLD